MHEPPSLESDRGTVPRPPVLSVGLPVYNGEKWIAETIESILQQSFREFELIIADNASKDQTEAICRDIAASDSRVRYHRNPDNIGIQKNFNLVFELASGKYFKWTACSDYCLAGFFEKCVEVLDSRPDVVLVYPRAYLLFDGPDGEPCAMEYDDNLNLEDDRPSTRFREYLSRERLNNVMHGLIRSSALRQTALIRSMSGSDISMIAELSLQGKFVEIPDRLFARRFDPETSSVLMTASMIAQRDVFGAPSVAQRINLHSYRFVTTFRASIGLSEKIRVWIYLLRRLAALRYQFFRKITRIVIPGR